MALEVIALKRSNGDFSISIDLKVDNGETLALVGPSGSGKTTALNLIAGLAEPDSGRICIDGEDISRLPSWKRNISIVFQDLALFPHLNVGGNIAYGLFIHGVKRKERLKIINEKLNLVRLPGYASRRIETLSGGERQRVAIARSLASSPRALLLDEPFSNLDAPLRKDLRREFLEIRSHSQAPCIFVTHDREEAVMLGDRVALMNNGRIIETAPGKDILLTPNTEFAAGFFGAGRVLPCKIVEKRRDSIEVSSPLGFFAVPAGSEFDPLSPRLSPMLSHMLFIPNDAILLEETAAAKADSAGLKSFEARFTKAIFEGSNVVLELLPAPWENNEPLPFEVIAGPRTKPPAPNSMMTLYVDQSLLRFVR